MMCMLTGMSDSQALQKVLLLHVHTYNTFQMCYVPIFLFKNKNKNKNMQSLYRVYTLI